VGVGVGVCVRWVPPHGRKFLEEQD